MKHITDGLVAGRGSPVASMCVNRSFNQECARSTVVIVELSYSSNVSHGVCTSGKPRSIGY